MSERDLFEAAVELPPENRGAYLDGVCGADEALRQRLEALFRVAQNNVAHFVECCVLRELGQGIDGDAALESVSLSVPVGGRETDLLDT